HAPPPPVLYTLSLHDALPIASLIWLFFLFSVLTPMLQQRIRQSQRLAIIRQLERKRGSRVITLIHRQESVSLLRVPVTRYIDIDDSERVLRAIKLTPPEMPLDLVLHTPGGLVLAAEQIAQALVRHRGPVTVFIPHYAMSGGTLLALAADHIVMDENAVLGPVDPQIGGYAAVDILSVLEQKPIAEIDDTTIVQAQMAKKALKQVRELVIEITTANGVEREKAERLADELTSGQWTHDYPISYEHAVELG